MSVRIEELRYGVPFGHGQIPEQTDLEMFKEHPRENLYFLAWLTAGTSPRTMENRLGLEQAIATYKNRLQFTTMLMEEISKEQIRRNDPELFTRPEGRVQFFVLDSDFASDSMLRASQEKQPVLGERVYRPSVIAMLRSLEDIVSLDHPETKVNQQMAIKQLEEVLSVSYSLHEANTLVQPKWQDTINFLSGSM